MGTVVHPVDRDDAGRLARRLLAVAGESRHDEVRTVSVGPWGVAFEVPDDVAAEVLGGTPADGADGPLLEQIAGGGDAPEVRPPAAEPAGPGGVLVADSAGPGGKASRRSRR